MLLSTPALDILEVAAALQGCRRLVPSRDTLKPFLSIKNGWQRATGVAPLQGLRIHNPRQSAASFMVNRSVDLFAVFKVLGHAIYQSTQRYSHLANDTLLKSVEPGAAKQQLA